ncbi:hypothetical protein VTO58DRAFT_100890 [Aureobasidium pullulans]
MPTAPPILYRFCLRPDLNSVGTLPPVSSLHTEDTLFSYHQLYITAHHWYRQTLSPAVPFCSHIFQQR